MKTFWSNESELQAVYDALNRLVPVEGSVKDKRKHPALEKMRVAANCYYDLYNNGLWNRAAQFARVFGIASSQYRVPGNRGAFYKELYEKVELEMRRIVLAAAEEQINRLNP